MTWTRTRKATSRPLNGPATRVTASVALVVGLALGGCGGGGTNGTLPGGGLVCNDTVTGQCIPCPGVSLCIDPVSCIPVQCQALDVVFGGSDALGGGEVDGGDGNGEPSDADTASDSTADGAADSAANSAADSTADSSADTAPADTTPPGCVDGTKGCYDKVTPALCVDKAWAPSVACKAGWACAAGACTCAKECEAIGQKTCTGSAVAAVKSCELDGDGCLHWGVPVACNPDELCQGGLCVKKSACTPACPVGQLCDNGVCKADPNLCNPPCSTGQLCQNATCVGTLSCGQIMACIDQFSQGPTDQLTIDSCMAKGSPTAVAQYKARKACIAVSCQTLIDQGKAAEAMLCVYSKCGAEQTTCTGVGSNDCGGLGGCLSGCGNSTVCLGTCHSQASVEAIQKWYGLLLCGDQFCAGQTGNAFAQCTSQKCQSAYQSCFGSTGQGGLSCGGILQCAGQCGGSKDCAQNCKAQGSAAGINTLNALLACNTKYCETICNNGSQQQCDSCLSIYCSKESAACN